MTEMTEVERLRRERDMAYSERDNAIAHRDSTFGIQNYLIGQADEEGYERGAKRTLIGILRYVVMELGATMEDDDEDEDGHILDNGRLLVEREEAILTLRRVCKEHGDNDWSDDLHLSDIIEKHLERYLDQ